MTNMPGRLSVHAFNTRYLGLSLAGAVCCLSLLLPQATVAKTSGGATITVWATNGTTAITSGMAASKANGTDFGVCIPGKAYTNTLYVSNDGDGTLLTISSWTTNGPGFTFTDNPSSVANGVKAPFKVIYLPSASGSNTVALVINYSVPGAYTVNLAGSGTVNTPPVISAQPVSAVVTIGSMAILSVSNSGTGPFGYQWLKDGAILQGRTNSTVNFDPFQFTDSGSYSVVITNALGMTISMPASLSVPNAPLRTWGWNNYGQLGNGTTTDTNRPIQVASNVVAASGGNAHSLFVKANGTLWAMGLNRYGQLGNGTDSGYTANSLPVQVASNVVAAAAGIQHSLFLKMDGALWAMGLNSSGQLGNGTTTNTNRPIQVASNVVAAAGGHYHSLFVKADGTLWAMGANGSGQLGNGTTNNASLPVQVASNVVAVAAGQYHSMFMKTDGTLWCMGENDSGQLGNGTTTDTNLPAQVASNVVAASGGNSHSLFVKADGTLWAMGYNGDGQLGNVTTSVLTNRPIQVAGGLLIAGLAKEPSSFHSLVIAGALPGVAVSNRTVTFGQTTNFTASVTAGDGPFTYQWQYGGTNIVNATNATYTISGAAMSDAGSYDVIVAGTYGTTTSIVATLTVNKANQTITSFPAIGNKITTDTVGLSATASSGLSVSFSTLSVPAIITGGTNLTFRGTGSVSIVASQAGDADWKAAPNVTNTFSVKMAPPTITVQPVSAVVTGQFASLSVSNSGTAPFGYKWIKDGVILSSQTNSTLNISSFKFTDSGSYSVVIANSVGMSISLPASLSVPDAPLRAWGSNSAGQFGVGTNVDTNRPITVASNVVAAAGGLNYSLFVKADGTLWGMGSNNKGQLGIGTNVETNRPVQVADSVAAAAGGLNHSLFVKADRTLWAMGSNNNGQLGNGTYDDTNRPVQVAGNVVVAVAGGESHSLFVKADGTLWAMGRNFQGQLGNGTWDRTNRPVQVASNVVAAVSGLDYSLFVKADGTLWAMGYNYYGQLGNGTNGPTANINQPVQVASNVVAACGGYYHSLFVKADRTLWAMGDNGEGQLGNGTNGPTANINRPVQVASNVANVSGGQYHSLFVKADGTLWGMGINDVGQLGNGTTTRTNRPVQVSGGLLVASLAKETTTAHSLAIAVALPAVSVSDRTVLVGQTTNFTAIITGGDGPFTYQWQKNGTNVVSATNAPYTISGAAPSDAAVTP